MAQPQTDKSGQIVPRNGGGAPAQPKTLLQLVQKLTPEIARALPRHVNPDRMARVVTTALRTVPKLEECTPASFLGCVIQCAQLGLEPCTPLGHAYLIPFNNRRAGTVDCTLIIGYKGMIDLARRSGIVTSVYAEPVHEHDEFSWQLGTKPMINHRPSDKEGGKLTHVYAVARIRDSEPIFKVLTKAQVDERRGRSRASSSGPWVTDYEAMALKSAVRALAAWMPQSAEFARAVQLDEAADKGLPQLPELDDEIKKALLTSGAADRQEIEATGEVSTDEEPERESGEEG